MHFQGAAIGVAAFVIIGIFHPIVIKSEYYFGARIWPLFLIGGILSIMGSLLVTDILVSAILGILGFTALWSIRELWEQTKRVEKGWFPANPKRSSRGLQNGSKSNNSQLS